MLYNERAEFILQQLQLQSTVKVSELSRQLQVSVDTVRRDLKTMEQGGQIRCVRGGACLPESRVSFSNFTGREIIHSDLKREAARKALTYIKENDVVAMNSGTTNTILAQELANAGLRCTVVTNNYAAIPARWAARWTPRSAPPTGRCARKCSAAFTPMWRCFPSTPSTIKTATPTSAWTRPA